LFNYRQLGSLRRFFSPSYGTEKPDLRIGDVSAPGSIGGEYPVRSVICKAAVIATRMWASHGQQIRRDHHSFRHRRDNAMDIEIPKGTLSGTPVMFCRHIGNERDGTPIWQAPEPTLWQLKLLHSREFNWFTDAHELFVTMLALHSLARRINDNERGLALEAARSVVRIACDEFYRQCTETGIWNCPLRTSKNMQGCLFVCIASRCFRTQNSPQIIPHYKSQT
jgi:hypothetical protein